MASFINQSPSKAVLQNINESKNIIRIIESLINNEELLDIPARSMRDDSVWDTIQQYTSLGSKRNKVIAKRKLKNVLSKEDYDLICDYLLIHPDDGCFMPNFSNNAETNISNFMYVNSVFDIPLLDISLVDGFTMAKEAYGFYYSNFDIFSSDEKARLQEDLSFYEENKKGRSGYQFEFSYLDIKDSNLRDYLMNTKVL